MTRTITIDYDQASTVPWRIRYRHEGHDCGARYANVEDLQEEISVALARFQCVPPPKRTPAGLRKAPGFLAAHQGPPAIRMPLPPSQRE